MGQEYLSEHNVQFGTNPAENEANEVNSVSISPQYLLDSIKLREERKINYNTMRKLIRMILGGETRSPQQIVDQENLALITDLNLIKDIVLGLMDENPALVQKYVKSSQKKRSKALQTFFSMAGSDARVENLDMAEFNRIAKEQF